MELIIIILISILAILIISLMMKMNVKELKKIALAPELNKIAEKYPNNIEICKTILKKLKNEKVKIEENPKTEATIYIAISDKILIGNMHKSFTRIQTIAHECLHSIQERKILLFNFIYSNVYIIYFLAISLLKLFNILPYEMMFLTILIIGGFIYYFVRSYLENDAMIKARFLAKEYMENKKISSQEEINKIVHHFDKLNDIGIKSVNYALLLNVVIEILVFCVICMIR